HAQAPPVQGEEVVGQAPTPVGVRCCQPGEKLQLVGRRCQPGEKLQQVGRRCQPGEKHQRVRQACAPRHSPPYFDARTASRTAPGQRYSGCSQGSGDSHDD
ncbi:unnamed protein product, partial [Discosporangium mesarthrocarpum]